MYNALELLVWIAATFEKMHGLYFWSLLIATVAILPYNIGFIMQYFKLSYQWLGMVLDGIGWIGMITGQSLVLYSRLGLLLHNSVILRCVKWMIIVNATIWHTTTEALNFCSVYGGHRGSCSTGYTYIEKVQMTVFCIQEFIISGIYMWQTARNLKVISKEGSRKVMWELFCINLVIVCLDIGLLVVEYLDYHAMEQTVKGFVYSVKLKLEFLILGKLVDLVHSSNRNLSSAFASNIFMDHRVSGEDGLHSGAKSDATPQRLRELDKSSASEHIRNAAIALTQSTGNFNERSAKVVASGSPLSFNDTSVNGMSDLQRRRTAESDYAEALRSISSRSG